MINIRQCPACGSAFFSSASRLAYGAEVGRQAIFRCANCLMVYAEAGLIQCDYDAYYRERSKYAHIGTDACPEDMSRHEHTANVILSAPTVESVLDFGCANGILAKILADRGCAVAGYDPSLEATVEAARARGVRVVSLQAGETFDAVVLSHVLEHVYDVDQVMAQVVASIRPGGVVYLEVPNAAKYSAWSPFQDFNFEHINHFTLATLCVCAGRFGLVPLRTGEKSFRVGDGIEYHAIFGLFRRLESDGLEKYVERSRSRLKSICEGLAADLGSEKRIIVWGAGELAKKLIACEPLAGCDICLVDSNPALHGYTVAGYEVLRPSEVGNWLWPIVVASVLNQDGIINSIIGAVRGVKGRVKIIKLRGE